MLACSTGVIGEPVHLRRVMDAPPVARRGARPRGWPRVRRRDHDHRHGGEEAAATAAGRTGSAARQRRRDDQPEPRHDARVRHDRRGRRPGDLAALAHERLKPRFDALTVDGVHQHERHRAAVRERRGGRGRRRPGRPAWVGGRGRHRRGRRRARVPAHPRRRGRHARSCSSRSRGPRRERRRAGDREGGRRFPPREDRRVRGDPNPGRILQAVGSSGVEVHPLSSTSAVGDTPVARGGVIPPAYFEPRRPAGLRERAMRSPRSCSGSRVGEGPGRVARPRVRPVLRLRPDQRGVHDVTATDCRPRSASARSRRRGRCSRRCRSCGSTRARSSS